MHACDACMRIATAARQSRKQAAETEKKKQVLPASRLTAVVEFPCMHSSTPVHGVRGRSKVELFLVVDCDIHRSL